MSFDDFNSIPSEIWKNESLNFEDKLKIMLKQGVSISFHEYKDHQNNNVVSITVRNGDFFGLKSYYKELTKSALDKAYADFLLHSRL